MQGLFNFEQDGRYPLRRIPMIIRFNLDACGVRLPLIAWTLLSREQRELLVALPCKTEEEQSAYCQRIIEMLQPHADNPDAKIEFVSVEASHDWRDTALVPQQIAEQLTDLSLPILDSSQWKALSDLQRFALLKLTRGGHKNDNLLPALKEFGLA
jgi:hypothetical protein